MRKKQLLTGVTAAAGIIILILDGRTAVSGAQNGIDLCIRTVIPSLFPFLFLSVLLTGSLYGNSIPFLKAASKWFDMPEGSEVLLISGFLGGYPAGAQAVAFAYQGNYLDKKSANRLLMFCSNAGPAFLFGMISGQFPKISDTVVLWLIHILSAFCVSALFPSTKTSDVICLPKQETTIDSAIRTSVQIMATICSWIILFRILLDFMDRWYLWRFPAHIQVIINGIFELSNGICLLSAITNIDFRFVICSAMLAWGGLCVTLQTMSVIGPLSLKAYLKGKSAQTVISIIFSISVCLKIWIPVAVLFSFLLILHRKFQKSCSNPASVVV